MPARPRKTKQHLSVCADALGCLPYRLLPALCLIWGSTCLPTPAQAAPCPWVVTPATSQKLYDILQALPPGDCTLTGQSAGSAQIDQQWQGRQGQLNLPWQARACQAINMNDLEDVRHRGQLEPRSLLPFAQACPLTAALVQKRMGINDFPAAIGPTPAPEPSRPPSPESTVSAQVQGLAAAEVLAIALLLGWLAQTWRRHRRGPTQGWQAQKPWWQAALALFALALCLRFAVTPVPANWYTPVLGRSGLSVEDRYGLADIALQWLLRACLPWHDRTLFAAHQVLGAAVVPLWLVALRQRAFPLRIAVFAAGLLAIQVLHVRLSASASAHVLVAFVWMACLVAAQEARRQGLWRAWQLGILASILAALAIWTRVDSAPCLLAIAAWLLVKDRCEVALAWQRRLLIALIWLMICGLLLIIVLPLLLTAVVSRGTPLPQLAERWQAVRDLLPELTQFLTPRNGWIGPGVALLVLLGLLPSLRQRPWLGLATVASWLVIAAGLGRSPHDFIMMRYYLPVLPLLTWPAAMALEALPKRSWLEPRVLTPVLLLVVGLASGAAWQRNVTFQDEFLWLKARLAQVPADCTVAQVGVSDGRVAAKDVDCCLDLPRSPLAVDSVHKLVTVDSLQSLQQLSGRCLVYYQGPVCSLQATPEMQRRNPDELRYFRKTCAEIQDSALWQPLASGSLTPLSHTDAFAGHAVPVRLWQLPTSGYLSKNYELPQPPPAAATAAATRIGPPSAPPPLRTEFAR